MGRREELESEWGKLTVKKQELEKRLSELEGKAEDLTGPKEPPRIIVTTEKLAQIDDIRREIEAIEAKRKEIMEETSKLPRKQG